MMRVLITRPDKDGARSAALLAGQGYDPLAIRLTEIVPLDPPFRAVSIDAVIATSAHAFEALPAPCRKALDRLPVYTVGERTAEAAKAAGLSRIRTGPGDAAGLAEMVLAEIPSGGAVLYLAGEPRKPVIEERLSDGGLRFETLIVYRAQPLAAPPPEFIDALGESPLAVLHYSRAAAASFAELAIAGGRKDHAREAIHVCLSQDVAAGLAGLDARDISIAADPREEALFEALATRLAKKSPHNSGEGDVTLPPRYSGEKSDISEQSMSETESGPAAKRGRRKPQTIDLTPAEVSETSVSPAAADEAGLKDIPASEPLVSQAEEVSAPASGDTQPKAEEKAEAPQQDAFSQDFSKDFRAPSPAFEPRLSLLPGALAGAAAALAIFGISYFLPSSSTESRLVALEGRTQPLPAPPADLKPVTDRLALVEERLPALENAAAVQEKSIGELAASLASMKQSIERVDGASKDITALRARLDELASGASGTADAAAVASLAQRLTAAEQALGALAPADLAPLESRLKTAEDDVSALKIATGDLRAAAEAVKADPAVSRAARLAAMDALTRKIVSGENFAAELEIAAAFAPAAPSLPVLKDNAGGLPSYTALAAEFTALSPKLSEALAPPVEDQSMLQRLAQSASGLVEVTPLEGAAGPPGSFAARVTAAITAGNARAALDELGSLPDAARTAAEPIIKRLETRLGAENALAELRGSVMGSP
jgi:uroporphyrinogen-III synthase